MKKVLIALDYNPSATIVAEKGFELAGEMNANIALVHVLSDITYYSSLNYSPITGFDSFNTMNLVQSSGIDELEKAANDYLTGFKEHYNKPEVEILVKEGDFAQSILDAAKDSGSDVIVLGTHSRRGFDKILMGSVATQVVRKSELPVFIIPVRKG